MVCRERWTELAKSLENTTQWSYASGGWPS